MTVYGSANKMAWEYFATLRSLVHQCSTSHDRDEERRLAMMAVVHAVTVVEVFLNLWFRVHIERNLGQRDSLLADLKARKGLEHKLKKWPARFLSKSLDLTKGPGGDLNSLRELRNSLVHFSNSYDTAEIEPAVFVSGLADITAYDGLTRADAIAAEVTVVKFVSEIFRLSGTPKEAVAHALHAWMGMPAALPADEQIPSALPLANEGNSP